jgi:rare lipoprotein A
MKKAKVYFQLFIILTTLSACSQSPQNSKPNLKHPIGNYETGKASYYADKYQGRQTANGERFNQNARTAAHKTLAFGTWVKVTNKRNGRSVVVRINDRGPFVKGRVIDLSKSAFSAIANPRLGVIGVVVEIVERR